MELTINGSVAVSGPIEISASSVANRPPLAVAASFDPAVAYPETVVFCRLPHRVVDDPDYNVVRYRYQWLRNGVVVRDSTNASLADAVASGSFVGGDTVSCTVTPSDGALSAPAFTLSLIIRQRFSEWAATHELPEYSYQADPDGDGLANLVEYSLGLSPHVRSSLPLPSRTADGGYSWTLPLNSALEPGITVSVQTSIDLVTWTPATPDSTGRVWTAGTSEDTRRFFRLRTAVGPADPPPL